MNLKELSVTDRTLVEALAEIAQAESTEHSWSEIEPMLEYCWRNSHRKSALDWEAIAPLIRSACNRTH